MQIYTLTITLTKNAYFGSPQLTFKKLKKRKYLIINRYNSKMELNIVKDSNPYGITNKNYKPLTINS